MSRRYSVFGSFRFAFDGLKEAFSNEPNFQVHVVVGCFALIAGFIVGLNHIEWIILLFTISFVLILELFNTAIEAMVDLLEPSIHPKAKVAKDVSSAAVFVSSIMAIIIGLLIFIPKLLVLL